MDSIPKEYRAGCSCHYCAAYEKTYFYAAMRLEAAFMHFVYEIKKALQPVITRIEAKLNG